MSSTAFICETPMIIREQSASLSPPSPPSKKLCRRSSADLPSSPCESLCLPLLDHFDNEATEQENGLFLPSLPTLAPRPASTFPFQTLSIIDENEEPSFTLKKRSASLALPPLSLQPRTNKQKRTVHALCA